MIRTGIVPTSASFSAERRAILWGRAIVWLVLLIFAVAALPQAFIRSGGNHGRRDRRPPLNVTDQGRP